MSTDLNIFELDNAGEYQCQIWDFIATQAKLTISAVKEQVRVYLTFHGVVYFSGSFYWKGANFSRGGKQAALNLLKEYDKTILEKEHLVTDPPWQLYFVPLDMNKQIQIIAMGATLKTQFPSGNVRYIGE